MLQESTLQYRYGIRCWGVGNMSSTLVWPFLAGGEWQMGLGTQGG